MAVHTLADAVVIRWNVAQGDAARVTIRGNRTLALPTNGVDGDGYTLQVVQGPGGNHQLALDPAFDTEELGAPRLSGSQGADDILGFIYSDGTWHYVGIAGHAGLQGPKGDKGDQGDRGITGVQGPTGPQGDRGPIGPQGIQGNTGDRGPQGVVGPKGDTGDRGPQGVVGPQGPRGFVGPQGIQGEVGPVGPQGVQGEQGEVGPQGLKGDKGDQGDQGDQGYVGPYDIEIYRNAAATPPTPAGGSYNFNTGARVAPAGWANDPTVAPDGQHTFISRARVDRSAAPANGIVVPAWRAPFRAGNTGPQGPQGEQGIQGPVGPVGPQGPEGQRGPQGIQGATGPQGEQGETGPQGPEGTGEEDVSIGGALNIGSPSNWDRYPINEDIDGDYRYQFYNQIGATDRYMPSTTFKGQDFLNLTITPSDVFAQGTSADIIALTSPRTDGDGIRSFFIARSSNPREILVRVNDDHNIVRLDKLGARLGPKGDKGDPGDPGGPPGPQGPQGERGAEGAQGPQGAQGAQGDRGPQGLPGVVGDRGPVGPQGPAGIQGPVGPAGPTGPAGEVPLASLSVTPGGIPARAEVAGNYAITLSNLDATRLDPARFVRVEIAGQPVHSEAWRRTAAASVIDFQISAVESQQLQNNLATGGDTATHLEVIFYEANISGNQGDEIGRARIGFGIGHDELLGGARMSWGLERTARLDLTRLTVAGVGWTIPEKGLFEIYGNIKTISPGSGDPGDFVMVVTAQRLRASLAVTTIGHLYRSETIPTIGKPSPEFDIIRFVRTATNQLGVVCTRNTVDIDPLEIRRLF